MTLGEFMARPDAPWARCRALNDPFARALASGFDEATAWLAAAGGGLRVLRLQDTEAKSSMTLGEFMARPDAPWARCRALNDPFARALASGFDEAAAWWAVAPNTEEEAVEFWGAQPSLHGQVSPASYLWFYHGVTTAGNAPGIYVRGTDDITEWRAD